MKDQDHNKHMYIDVDLYTSQVNKTLGNFNENLLHL